MDHHTFVCGTSKSKDEDAYYIYHADRFWGTLHEAGITDRQLAPAEYRDLGREHGIYLTEIVDPDELRVASDSEIEPHQVRQGMERLIDRIQKHQPNRIGFVGKNAATWYYRFLEGKEITHSQASGHKSDRKNITGFRLEWDYFEFDHYLLSNTHRHWDRDIWVSFWMECLSDVSDTGECSNLNVE